MERTCTKCGEVKEVNQENFYFRGGGQIIAQCKQCISSKMKQHHAATYADRKELISARSRKAYTDPKVKLKYKYRSYRIRRQRKIEAAEILLGKGNVKCQLCPESDPVTLDFHHRDPMSKQFDICNKLTSRLWGTETMLSELAKCDVLCACCHKLQHLGEARVVPWSKQKQKLKDYAEICRSVADTCKTPVSIEIAEEAERMADLPGLAVRFP